MAWIWEGGRTSKTENAAAQAAETTTNSSAASKVKDTSSETAARDSANNIPCKLSNSQHHPDQRAALDTNRVTSSIPIGDARPRHQKTEQSETCSTNSSACPSSRSTSSDSVPEPTANGSSRWVYPSPQQFYNALKRKGFNPDEKDMDTYVLIVHIVLSLPCTRGRQVFYFV